MNKHFTAILLLVLVASGLIALGVEIPFTPERGAPSIMVKPENQGILRR